MRSVKSEQLFGCTRIIWDRQNYLSAPELFGCARIIWEHLNYLSAPELFGCTRIIWEHQNYLGAPDIFGSTRITWVHQDGNEDIVSGGAESCKEIRSFGNGIYDIIHYIIH